MLQLLTLLIAATPIAGGVPDRIILRDPQQGPTAVSDKFMIPQKAPDCRTQVDVQRALEQLRQGDPGDCFIRDKEALRRR